MIRKKLWFVNKRNELCKIKVVRVLDMKDRVIRVVEFSREGYKIRKVVWVKINCSKMKSLNFVNCEYRISACAEFQVWKFLPLQKFAHGPILRWNFLAWNGPFRNGIPVRVNQVMKGIEIYLSGNCKYFFWSYFNSHFNP